MKSSISILLPSGDAAPTIAQVILALVPRKAQSDALLVPAPPQTGSAVVFFTVRNASVDCTRETPGNWVRMSVWMRSKSRGVAIGDAQQIIGRAGEQVAFDDLGVAVHIRLEAVERGAALLVERHEARRRRLAGRRRSGSSTIT